jgi:hypothetical protein
MSEVPDPKVLTLNKNNTYVQNEGWHLLRRRLLDAANYHDAVETVVPVLYYAHPYPSAKRDFSHEQFHYFADQVNNGKLWTFLKEQHQAFLSGPDAPTTAYTEFLRLLCVEPEETDQFIEDFSSSFDPNFFVSLCGQQWSAIWEESRKLGIQQDETSYWGVIGPTLYRKLIRYYIDKNIAVPETFLELDQEGLDALGYDNFVASHLADKHELIEALSGSGGAAPRGIDKLTKVSREQEVYCIRYDQTFEDGTSELFGFCFLSVFYERLGWFLSSRTDDALHQRRRLGGRIGSLRTVRKNLEILATGH